MDTSFKHSSLSTCPQDFVDHTEWSDVRVENGRSNGIRRFADSVKSVVLWVVGSVSRWGTRRAAIRELRALSDRQLADIGLERSQIASTVEDLMQVGGETTVRIDCRQW